MKRYKFLFRIEKTVVVEVDDDALWDMDDIKDMATEQITQGYEYVMDDWKLVKEE